MLCQPQQKKGPRSPEENKSHHSSAEETAVLAGCESVLRLLCDCRTGPVPTIVAPECMEHTSCGGIRGTEVSISSRLKELEGSVRNCNSAMAGRALPPVSRVERRRDHPLVCRIEVLKTERSILLFIVRLSAGSQICARRTYRRT